MPLPSETFLPQPKNWQEFESICCDLFARIWKNDDTQKNGRSQKQNGIDVFGQPADLAYDGWAGVQCKGKDDYTNKNVNEVELTHEVENAKSFEPKLARFILATSGVRDGKIQATARRLSDINRSKGLFSISVWSW
jgi:hypothetical protein